jgi:hypothetical protein
MTVNPGQKVAKNNLIRRFFGGRTGRYVNFQLICEKLH